MPERSSWPDADAERSAEMAAADHASARLLNALQQLHVDLKGVPPGAQRARRWMEKREAALEAMARHAEFILSQFAFLDGERIAAPDARLLEAFCADPLECVAARYCWALLGSGEQATTLQGIIAATRAEHDAFVQMQAGGETPSRHPRLAALQEVERSHHKRADRTGYVLSVLRRLLVVQRQLGKAASPSTRVLEAEVADALEAAERAASTLREVRRAGIARRGS